MALESEGHTVLASDLVDYGTNISRRDFLLERSAPAGVETIVTNPPFKLAEQFAAHAKTLVPNVYLLLRLAFLEGLRWERGLSEGLAHVHVFAPRLPFMHRDGYEGKRCGASAIPFAWFVWKQGHTAPATLGWLNWRNGGLS